MESATSLTNSAIDGGFRICSRGHQLLIRVVSFRLLKKLRRKNRRFTPDKMRFDSQKGFLAVSKLHKCVVVP